MKLLMKLSMVLCVGLTGCMLPNVSSSVVEADSNGSLMAIEATHCGLTCADMAMRKAKEVCPHGYSIKNQSGGIGGMTSTTDVKLILRCER